MDPKKPEDNNKPMNAFEKASLIEKAAFKDILPYMKDTAFDGRFVITNKGNLSELLQKTVGDIIFNCEEEKVWAIEVKAEAEEGKNFYLETWSNKKWKTEGWMHKLQCDFLYYYFLNTKNLYSMVFPDLKYWAFDKCGFSEEDGRIWDFPEKEQKKYTQLNDTWGRCVPINIISNEVGYSTVNLTKL